MDCSRRLLTTLWTAALLAGSTAGVAAQDEGVASEPGVLAMGRFEDAQTPFAEVSETGSSLVQRGRIWTARSEMVAARLSGEVVLKDDPDRWFGGPRSDETFLADVLSGTIEITNDGGTWSGTSVGRSDATAGRAGVTYYELVGSGDYEGLSAVIFEREVWHPETEAGENLWNGVIFPGPLPPDRSDPAAYGPEQATGESGPAAFTELRVADVAEIDERTRDLTIQSPSVGEATVRLVLPAGFDEDPEATYPVLYLLHGATQDHAAWTEFTDVEELTADLDLLVVMPEAGAWGWYSDWWNEGEGGEPAWETFHLSEVRDIIERDWGASDERIIAGLSMGGYGALHYATAHPELFKAVASFSGVVDPNGVGGNLNIDPLAWGDPDEQADVWAAHDPVGMAAALDGKPVYLSWQDGQPGPLDPPGTTVESYDLEAWVAPQNEAMVARLEELGIPVTVDTGAGAHEWPYWQQGLHDALPMLLEALEE